MSILVMVLNMTTMVRTMIEANQSKLTTKLSSN